MEEIPIPRPEFEAAPLGAGPASATVATNSAVVDTPSPLLSPPPPRKKCESDSGLRVIVSLTTTPSRIHHIRPVIENLLHDQTYRPHKVNLYIPDRGIRDGREYEIPEWLHAFEHEHRGAREPSDPSVTPTARSGDACASRNSEAPDGEGLFSVVRVGKDHGPATKLLPSLALYPPIETGEPDNFRYLTVDDDVVLEPHAIELLVAGSLANPGAIVGLMGIYHVREGAEGGADHRTTSRTVYVHSEWLHATGEPYKRVGLLGGYRGVIYPREVWAARNGGDTLLRDLEEMTTDGTPYLSDDHLFCWNALRRGYRACVVASPYLRKPYDRDDPLGCLNITFLELANPLSVEGTGCGESHARLREYYLSRGWILPECDVVH